MHLVHALNVPGAVPLLGFQTHFGVSCIGEETRGVGERVKAAQHVSAEEHSPGSPLPGLPGGSLAVLAVG